jgi:hypothetical protein
MATGSAAQARTARQEHIRGARNVLVQQVRRRRWPRVFPSRRSHVCGTHRGRWIDTPQVRAWKPQRYEAADRVARRQDHTWAPKKNAISAKVEPGAGARKVSNICDIVPQSPSWSRPLDLRPSLTTDDLRADISMVCPAACANETRDKREDFSLEITAVVASSPVGSLFDDSAFEQRRKQHRAGTESVGSILE